MYPQTAIEWLHKLVSFDTTSRNSNLPLVEYICGYLRSVGVTPTLIFNESKDKANIFAALPGSPTCSKRGGVILSGHLDTVPVDGQIWKTDPFSVVEKSNRLYGRGTCDMKGFIAVCLYLVPHIVQIQRKKGVFLAFTFDEEVGCLGGRALTKFIVENNLTVDGCLVGEPTSNKVVVAHKGICVWEALVQGKAAHSSFALTRKGCNAIDYAAKLIVKIREIAESMQRDGARDTYYDVPYSSMSTNIVSGGNAVNTIPSVCKVTYEFRNLPSVSQESIQEQVNNYVSNTLLPQMKAECSDAKITFSRVAHVPSLNDADENSPFTSLIRLLTGDRDRHKLGCTTEAGQFAEIKVPVVVCGPGSISVAHQPNEFVPIHDLSVCERIIRQLVEKMDTLASPHL